MGEMSDEERQAIIRAWRASAPLPIDKEAPPLPPTTDELIERLDRAIRAWDEAYNQVLYDSKGWPEKATEEKLKIATRNEIRIRGEELPEIVRWRLRARIGYRAEEE